MDGELHYWDITFDMSNADQVYTALNEIQPDMHTVGRNWLPQPFAEEKRTTMVELTEADALLFCIKANVKIERLDK